MVFGGASVGGGGMPGMAGMPSGTQMSGTGTPSGGTPSGQASAPAGPSRRAWTPLGEATASGATSMGGPGGGGMTPGLGPPPGKKGGAMITMPGAAPGGGAALRGGAGGTGAARGSAGRRPMTPGMQQMQPGRATPTTASDADDHGLKRTEFVILFIWKEPTASDRLRNLPAPDQGGAAPAASAGADSQPHSLRPRSKKQKTD